MPTSACSGDPSLLCSRTDAIGTTTTYAYDGLNRLTGKTYSDSTPSVTYSYDQSSYNGLTIANGKGLRTGMSDGSGATAWSFDQVGRTTAIRKTVNSNTKQANYTYNQDGTVNTLQDFSGTTFTYAYDSVGRQTGVSDGSSNTYASSGAYNAASELTGLTHQLTSGSATYVRSLQYNSRMQPSVISATQGTSTIQSLSYGYGTSGTNNGNIVAIVNGMASGRDQTYTYDNLNRLQEGDDSNWGETYTYDPWGNMYQRTQLSGHGGDNWSVTADGSNHLSNLTYDADGRVTEDQFSNTYTYDAEGRALAAGGGAYVYDGDGNRVKKTVGGTATLYWPGAVAGVVDESNSGATSFGRQVYVAGVQVWSEDTSGAGKFLFQDHLGSARITGNAAGTTYDDIDYLPFGEIYANYGTASDIHYLFTGYESDSESSTNYAVYRNLSGSMARFNRPDPYDGSYDQSNPQSFNRYAYVRNSPMRLTDPLGLDAGECTSEESCANDGPCPEGGVCQATCDPNYCQTVYGDSNSPIDFEGVNQTSVPFLSFGPGASGPAAPSKGPLTPKGNACKSKVTSAVNKALNVNATYEGTTAGLNDSTYGPGWRNGAYNFNFFAAGYGGTTSPGNCGRFQPGVTGTGGSLHVIVPGGGCNPGGDPYITPTGIVTINGQTGFQFTAHIDSAYAYSFWGAIQHFIEDVLLRYPHGC